MNTAEHVHQHNDHCGHTAVMHAGHMDYIHDRHLDHQENGTTDIHRIEVSAQNPDACTISHPARGHDTAHRHGANCGHEAIAHGDHTDYVVSGTLHHAHGEHCDDHGRIEIVH